MVAATFKIRQRLSIGLASGEHGGQSKTVTSLSQNHWPETTMFGRLQASCEGDGRAFLSASRRQTKDLETACLALFSKSHFSWRDVKRQFLFALTSRKRLSLSHVFLGRRDLFLQLIAPAASLFRQFFTDPHETLMGLAMLRSPRPHSFKASILAQCCGLSC